MRGFSGLISGLALGLLGTIVLPLTFSTSPSEAKATVESAHSLSQTYHAALRLLRVDMGLTIKEKDPDAAYILFDYKTTENGERIVPGSLEMIDTGTTIRVSVQIPQMPRYHEQVIVNALAKKLQTDYGDAPKPKPSPPADAGPDVAPSPP